MDAGQIQAARQVREAYARDPHQPAYHFVTPEGLCMPFDPNGALFWKGKYHLFYIFQDPRLTHGGHCWGHASSVDLVHWAIHPTALAPREGDPDIGIFSGGAFVNKEGVPTIIYHGVGAGTCIATAEDDDLIVWKKSPHNPVICEPREGEEGWGVYNVFDPHAWLEGDTYHVILGGKVKPRDIRDTAYLFNSTDLVRWEYVHPFYEPNPAWTGEEEDCACPDFFRLGDRWALVCISHPRGARYYLGRYENETFYPEEHHRMNWPGGTCFAPETLLDGKGRRIFWAWVLECRSGEAQRDAGWSGVMTLPRILSLGEDGRMRFDPPREFERLRLNARGHEDIRLEAGEECVLDKIAGDCLELNVTVQPGNARQVGLAVRRSPDGAEQTRIVYVPAERKLLIDTTRSTTAGDVCNPYPIFFGEQRKDVRIQEAPLALPAGEPLALRVFLDRSILEVFANRRQCVTQRIYPVGRDSVGVAVFAAGGAATVERVEAWDMAAAHS